jgi:hypothetical protein
MSTHATHHVTHHSTFPSAGAAALATALVIGGVAAAGIALASTHGSAVTVQPGQVQPGPLPGRHDFTAAGKRQAAPQGPRPGVHDFQVRRVPVRRG